MNSTLLIISQHKPFSIKKKATTEVIAHLSSFHIMQYYAGNYLACLIAACAAANLAIGTRNGEQDT